MPRALHLIFISAWTSEIESFLPPLPLPPFPLKTSGPTPLESFLPLTHWKFLPLACAKIFRASNSPIPNQSQINSPIIISWTHTEKNFLFSSNLYKIRRTSWKMAQKEKKRELNRKLRFFLQKRRILNEISFSGLGASPVFFFLLSPRDFKCS